MEEKLDAKETSRDSTALLKKRHSGIYYNGPME
jgi:hypothetical protein